MTQKDIYTGASSYDSYKYNFNYMNIASKNLDATNNSTLFSYDGLGRLKKTKNADTSSTLTSFSYLDSLTYYFGYLTGFFEKQIFTDEEGNNFEKYIDAVGNLLVEKKFILVNPGSGPVLEELNTEYKYDSLYRISKVKTPEGKLIHYYYDGYGRQSKRITPDAGQTEYIYDKNSNLTYSQDANQRTTDANKYSFRNYDGLNRLTGIGENVFLDDSPANGDQFTSSNPDYYLTVNVYDTISNSIVNIFNGVNGDIYPNYTKDNLAASAYRTRYTDAWNFKYYRYDVRGRVIKMWNIISGFDTLITEYIYNSQDQIIMYSHSGNGDPKTFRNTYDPAGRLDNVKYYVGWPDDPYPNYVNLAEYLYNENSQVDQQLLNDGGLKLNFYYNNRQWISEILESSDLINMVNDYFKNGNVKSQQLSGSYNDMFSNNSDLYQNYKYDKSNRLLESENNNQQYKDHYKIENKYDKDGNILELKRYDGAGSVMDNFNYAYYSNTNKLQRVTGSGTQYTYDANGNMTHDDINRNRDIKYDHRNLITQLTHKQIVFEDSLLYSTYYYYDEAGNRIRKKVYQYTGIQPADSVTPPEAEEIGDSPGLWDLVKDEVYSRSVDGRELVLYVNGSLKQSNIWGIGNEGYLTNADEPYFYLKDHLGSIRALTNDKNEVISSQDYDAWGYLLQGRQYDSDESVYKFTGKERDAESEYDYFGARYYDARIGRWGQIEPLLDKFISFSTYSYSVLNPLKFTDIFGQGPKITISGNEIDVNFSIIYTTKEVDAVFGLDQTQINVLETMSQNAHVDWSGDFVIGGELYSINVNVELTPSSQPFDIFASEKQRLAGGYNLTGDFTWDPQASEQLAHERGVGMSGNVLMMLSGDDLKPYKSSGSHEAGHAMSLGHEDATSRPYRYGSKLEKIWSVMGKVTIYEGKEYREKPTSNDWSKIFERSKINLKKNQSTYINN